MGIEIIVSGIETVSIPALPGPKLNSLPDELLAQGVQQGNHTHLSILVQRYHAPLLRYLFRMGNGNQMLAEDLVQETFLKLLGNIRQYQYPRPVRPWLYTIAHNLIRDHFKRADTQRTDTLPDEDMTQWQSEGGEPETAVITQESHKHLIATVAKLPIHQKSAILLRYVEELSLQEIGNVLNIPVGTVKSRLSLGLKRLRVEMR